MLIASFAMQALGSATSGQAQSQADEFKASLALQNAAIARQQGEAASQAQRRLAYRTQGSIIANYGASGVQSDNGSPIDVLANSAAMATLDNLTIKYNSELKAVGYENEAKLAMMGASNAKTSSLLNTAAYALKAGSIYAKYGGGGTAIPEAGLTGLEGLSPDVLALAGL